MNLGSFKPDWLSPDGTIALACADMRDVLTQIDPAKIGCVITDPPYEISTNASGFDGDRKYLKDIRGFTDEGFDPSVISHFPNWMVFCTAKQIPGMFPHVGKDRSWMLVTWNKPNPTPLVKNTYLPDTEYIFHCWSKGCLYGEYADKSRFIVYPAQQDLWHPNEKPIPVMRKCVKVGSDVGQVVLDPYAGSGTTPVVCAALGRCCIAIERDKRHYATMLARVRDEISRPRFDFSSQPDAIQRDLLAETV